MESKKGVFKVVKIPDKDITLRDYLEQRTGKQLMALVLTCESCGSVLKRKNGYIICSNKNCCIIYESQKT